MLRKRCAQEPAVLLWEVTAVPCEHWGVAPVAQNRPSNHRHMDKQKHMHPLITMSFLRRWPCSCSCQRHSRCAFLRLASILACNLLTHDHLQKLSKRWLDTNCFHACIVRVPTNSRHRQQAQEKRSWCICYDAYSFVMHLLVFNGGWFSTVVFNGGTCRAVLFISRALRLWCWMLTTTTSLA